MMSEFESIELNEYGTIRLEPRPESLENPRATRRGGQLTRGRRPEWLRVKAADSPRYRELAGLFRGKICTPCARKPCAPISANAGDAARPPSC